MCVAVVTQQLILLGQFNMFSLLSFRISLILYSILVFNMYVFLQTILYMVIQSIYLKNISLEKKNCRSASSCFL